MARKENPRILSYVLAWDGALAPNPSYKVPNKGDNYCTLAVCKPVLRRTANKGDWIVGLSGSRFGNRLVYAMVVAEILTFIDYYKSSEFQYKIPNLESKNPQIVAGDNFYKPLGDDLCEQLPSLHSNTDGTPNLKHKQTDLSGVFVLAALEYYYFGENSIELPKSLKPLIVRRGHRVTKEIIMLNSLRRNMDKQTVGVHGKPKLLGQR